MSESKKIPVEELRDLKQLLDEGLITNVEFEEKKKQLLGLGGRDVEKPVHFAAKEDTKTKESINAMEADAAKTKELAEAFNDIKNPNRRDDALKKLADSIVEAVPEPYNDAAFIDDDNYGLTPIKPIGVAGVVQEQTYLKNLNNYLNKQFSWKRTSSMSVEGVMGFVDVYEGSFKDEELTVYINPYAVITSDTIPKGLKKLANRQSSLGKAENPLALNKVHACIMASPYANSNEINWVSDFNLTYRSANIDSITPSFAVLWNNLEYYHSKKYGMNLGGLVVTFSDVVRVQAIYKVANAFAVMLAVFLENVNNKQDLRPLTFITLPFAFWVANNYEGLNGTVNDKIRTQIINEYNCFTNTDQKIKEYEEWVKEYVDEEALQQIESTKAGRYMVSLGERLLNLCEEKKKIKEGFLGLNTKTVRIPNPQLRNDLAAFLSRAVPNFIDEIAPFVKSSKEGK